MEPILIPQTPRYDPRTLCWDGPGFAHLVAGEQDRIARGHSPGALLIGIDAIPLIAAISPDLTAHLNVYLAAFLGSACRRLDARTQTGPGEVTLLWAHTVANDTTLTRLQHLNRDLNKLTLPWQGQTLRITASVTLRHRLIPGLEKGGQTPYIVPRTSQPQPWSYR